MGAWQPTNGGQPLVNACRVRAEHSQDQHHPLVGAYAAWVGRTLPNEAQFEHAARAGSAPSREPPPVADANTWQGEFPARDAGADGWRTVAPAGCFRSNAFGLLDLIGNVWEWTTSRWTLDHSPLIGDPSPGVRATSTPLRVIKGGSFLCAPNYCARYRPAARHAQEEDTGASHLGFRTARAPIR